MWPVTWASSLPPLALFLSLSLPLPLNFFILSIPHNYTPPKISTVLKHSRTPRTQRCSPLMEQRDNGAGTPLRRVHLLGVNLAARRVIASYTVIPLDVFHRNSWCVERHRLHAAKLRKLYDGGSSYRLVTKPVLGTLGCGEGEEEGESISRKTYTAQGWIYLSTRTRTKTTTSNRRNTSRGKRHQRFHSYCLSIIRAAPIFVSKVARHVNQADILWII